jgi:hypothetical protein
MGRKVLQADGTFCYTENCRIHNRSNGLVSARAFNDAVDRLNGVNPLLAKESVPSVSFKKLFHVGTLDRGLKKSESYEGQGFSVSLNPDEWRKIARLSGEVFSLEKSGNQFADYHELSAAQREAVLAWGKEKGYIEPVTSYDVSWFDDEWDQDMTMTFGKLDAAKTTADNYGVDVVPRNNFSATSRFPDSTVKTGSLNVEDILFTAWVTEETSFDGVWWEDDLDESRLSAPRGVIVNRDLNGWLLKPV